MDQLTIVVEFESYDRAVVAYKSERPLEVEALRAAALPCGGHFQDPAEVACFLVCNCSMMDSSDFQSSTVVPLVNWMPKRFGYEPKENLKSKPLLCEEMAVRNVKVAVGHLQLLLIFLRLDTLISPTSPSSIRSAPVTCIFCPTYFVSRMRPLVNSYFLPSSAVMVTSSLLEPACRQPMTFRFLGLNFAVSFVCACTNTTRAQSAITATTAKCIVDLCTSPSPLAECSAHCCARFGRSIPLLDAGMCSRKVNGQICRARARGAHGRY